MTTQAQTTMLNLLKTKTPTTPHNTQPTNTITHTLKENIHTLTQEQIQDLIGILTEQATKLALENSDLDALTEEAYNTMYNKNGEAHHPRIHKGLLICAGAHRKNSTTSKNHTCEFVCVNNQWVWQNPEHVSDEIRKIPIGNKQHLRVITIIPIQEGDTVDYIAQTYNPQTGHKPKKKTSYIVKNGQLEITTTRETPRNHSGF